MAIRIPRAELDYAIAAVRVCANAARDRQGLRILFPLTDEQAERAILAGLAMWAPGGLPHSVMPMDVEELTIVKEPAVAQTRDMHIREVHPVTPPLGVVSPVQLDPNVVLDRAGAGEDAPLGPQQGPSVSMHGAEADPRSEDDR